MARVQSGNAGMLREAGTKDGESEIGRGGAEQVRRLMRREPEPRGLHREMAARYIGLSPSKFDQLVSDGRMPKAKRIDGRRVWDRWLVDQAFDAIDNECELNPWE